MTKLTADTLLDTIDADAPISADDFQEDIAYKAKTIWCDLAYKERFEEAADQIWSVLDELTALVEINDMPAAAQSLLDIAEQSGKLSETQQDELEDLRRWVDQHGSMYNFRRALSDA